MPFCGNCGTQFETGTRFCPGCGTSTALPTQQPSQPRQPRYEEEQPRQRQARQCYSSPTVPGSRSRADNRDAQDNKTMAILAYFGPLLLIPLFAAKDSPFARYHTNQDIVLALACIAFSIVCSPLYTVLALIFWRLVFIGSIPLSLVGLVFTVLAIIGIINAAKGRKQDLPLISGIRILR